MPIDAAVPLALVLIAATLHVLGERRAVRLLGRPRSTQDRCRALAFYAGLATILGALVSPLDGLSEKLFWVHMSQHVLLLTVAAPLIALGAPWSSMWRPLPLGLRRRSARAVARSRALAPLRALGRLLGSPLPAWIAFNVDLVLWHIPAIYAHAIGDGPVHDLEHASFLIFGVLLWVQVIDSPPVRARLRPMGRVAYMVGASIVSWVLSLWVIFSSSPLYAYYAQLAHRPGGLSALADQQIAGGVMLVPGSIAASVYVFFELYRWISRDQGGGPPRDGARRVPAAPQPQPGSGPARELERTVA
jgi:cytochrome c oxidase assembly factor CtaG